jgi:hypothetical protein
MAAKKSVAVRNAQGDAMETAIGVSPKLQIFSGAAPADCAAADSGTKLAEGDLPADFLAAAAAGAKSKSGTWTLTGVAAGTAGHFRLKDSTGATCHLQGTVTITGGGGDMIVDNTSIAVSQVITVNTFTDTQGNA